MPLYMDIHNLQGATAEQIAQAHAADLEVQEKYHVEYLKYWFNESQGKAFCLVDAPSPEAAQLVHSEAHGQTAERIVEVEPELVRHFSAERKSIRQVRCSSLVAAGTSATPQSGPFSSRISSARRTKPWGTMQSWLC